MPTPKRLFIIDAMAMAYRAHYAFSMGKPLTTSDGRPTAALFGSAMFMSRLIEKERPDYLLVACDAQKPTFRHALYDKYKANRSAMPDDLRTQIPHIIELLKTFGCKVLRQEGLEADDLIGSVVRRFAGPGLAAYIVSGDKDFMQLVDDHTFLYQPKKGDEAVVVDRSGVIARFGVPPERVIDCLALIGDASDNVPGVHGIGDKGATKLIEEHGALEGLYAALELIGNTKQRNALTEHRDLAFLSRQLVTIKTDCDVPLNLEDLVCAPDEAVANEQLLDLCRTFEFRGLATKIEDSIRKRQPQAVVPLTAANFDRYLLVNTKAQLAALDATLSAATELCFDTETTGLAPLSDKPIGVSFAVDEGGAFYLPLVAKHLEDVTPEDALALVAKILTDATKRKIGHNVKFDLHMLANAGVDVQGPFVDTMVADWLLQPEQRAHGLDALCLQHLGYTKIPTASLIGDKGQYSMLDAPLADLATYACEDADLTLRLARHQAPLLERQGLLPLLHDVEMPLIPVLTRMERAGIHVDHAVLRNFSARLGILAEKLEAEVYAAAETEFNVNSPKQLGDVLFNQLKLHETLGVKGLKKTKTGFSTDESVLSRLAEHPLPRAVLAYREVAKLKNTYVDTLPALVNKRTGRVHTSFHQTGTATGRLSSSDPNVQNIPIRSALGQEVRKAFTPGRPGYVMLSADYSQIELRLLAHLANEDALCEAYEKGEDIHRATAARIFSVPPADVDNTMRARAKAVNFGVIYGMGPRRLAAETGVTMAEATAFIDRYFQSYPGIAKYMEQTVKDAHARGYTETLLGRRRPIDGMSSGNGRDRAAAANAAANAPIQGSAADLIKLAMIAIDRRFRAAGLASRMLLQVHDELVFECPEAELASVKEIVGDAMRTAMKLKVPLDAGIGAGPSWLEAH